MIADLQDTIYEVFSTVPYKVTRPSDVMKRVKAREKARKTKKTIENTEWEAV